VLNSSVSNGNAFSRNDVANCLVDPSCLVIRRRMFFAATAEGIHVADRAALQEKIGPKRKNSPGIRLDSFFDPRLTREKRRFSLLFKNSKQALDAWAGKRRCRRRDILQETPCCPYRRRAGLNREENPWPPSQ
jgi:hypothetical protein